MKKFKNTVIITDLDGTFLNDKEGLVKRNLDAIEYFKENGGFFTVATGRASEHALGAVPCLAELVNFPAVVCNGACLYDFRTGERPYMSVIRYDDVLRLADFIDTHCQGAGIRASSPDYCFVCRPEDTKNAFVCEELKKYPDSNLIAPIEQWKDIKILKVVVRIEAELLERAMKALDAHFGDEFAFTQSWATIIDIQPKGINKGSTITRYIRQRLGSDARIYACGDYFNDIEMLRAADVAVCPSNAHDSVKKISDLCLCSNNDGLVADLVEYIENN